MLKALRTDHLQNRKIARDVIIYDAYEILNVGMYFEKHKNHYLPYVLWSVRYYIISSAYSMTYSVDDNRK